MGLRGASLRIAIGGIVALAAAAISLIGALKNSRETVELIRGRQSWRSILGLDRYHVVSSGDLQEAARRLTGLTTGTTTGTTAPLGA